jgi:Ca2+-binding RTX toxin-like protein
MPARGDRFGDRFGPSELIDRGARASLDLPAGLSRGPSPVPLPPAGAFDLFPGTTGDDTFTGTGGDDVFLMEGGGNDTVKGKKGDDVFQFGAALTFQDQVDGGSGDDTLFLDGDYSFGLVFAATTMTGVETVILDGGFDYSLKFANETAASAKAATLDARQLGASDSLTFFGSPVVDGTLTILGGAGGDAITIGQSGEDIVRSGSGEDTIRVLGNLTAASRIDGGAGADTVVFDGDYSSPLLLGSKTIRNVTIVEFIPGNDYNLVFDDATAPSGILMLVDGSGLNSGDSLTADGSAETGDGYEMIGGFGPDALTGGQGADRLSGGSNDDTINASMGGDDEVFGGNGNDTFNFAGTIASDDSIDGGNGADTLNLEGDYPFETFLDISSVEFVILAADHDYALRMSGSAGASAVTVDGSGLGPGNALNFAGSLSTAVLIVIGGQGDDVIAGGQNLNTVDATLGGDDDVTGGDGDDVFDFGAALTEADAIDGGLGSDTLNLDGDYLSRTLIQIAGVEDVVLASGHDYRLALDTAQSLTVDGNALAVDDVLDIDAGDSTVGVGMIGGDSADIFKGGAGADNLIGGDGSDRFRGNAGPDQIIPGTGANRFIYGGAADSTSTGFDAILGADMNDDKFDLPGAPGAITAVDAAVTTGALSSGTFDANMTVAMNGHLGANHAILFTPNSGNLAGHTFLIVDLNAAAGYQAGADLVVRFIASGTLTASDFI